MVKQVEMDSKHGYMDMHHERLPSRRLANHSTFASVYRRLWETGSFVVSNKGKGHSRIMPTSDTKEYVWDRFGLVPSTNTQAVAADIRVCHTTVWRVLREEYMQPFHVQMAQCLNADDYSRRLDFVRWMIQMKTINQQFHAPVIFTYEVSFTI
ncbi:uncharacterized protein NPIL_493821 [Nephila pilipes]|uniref:Uncharacterized protein n=1 Tax=Nephila pilipes TaxID=299642 RepID=A0A8X6QAA8_NEPPI|nr:uncharacterized protein NPIL_493821 [Nephila pilipes]